MSISISGTGAITGVSTNYSFDKSITAQAGIRVTGGSVGIGTTNPTEKLSIGATTGYLQNHGIGVYKPHTIGLKNGVLVYTDAGYNASSSYRAAAFKAVGVSGHALGISTDANSNGLGGTINARINFDGSAIFTDDIKVQNSSNTSEYLSITYQGIDFQNTGAGSSTSVNSHLLDDYEEGSWTPVYYGQTTAGSYTHGGPCTYTKIGNVVHLRATLNNITTVSIGSGNLIIGGLPFLCDATNNARQVGTVQLNQFNNSVTDIFGICVRTPPGTTTLQVIGSRHDAGLEIFQVTDKNSDNSDISLQITYEIEPA